MKLKLFLLTLFTVCLFFGRQIPNGHAENDYLPPAPYIDPVPEPVVVEPVEPTQPKSLPVSQPTKPAASTSAADSCGDATIFPRVFGGSDYKVLSGHVRDAVFERLHNVAGRLRGIVRRCR